MPDGRAASLAWLPYPFRSALRRWRGMVGMVLGVGLALGFSLTMLAVNSATIDLLVGDYRRSGAELYVVAKGAKLVAMIAGETPGTIKHSRNVLTQIRGLPGVNEAVGVLSWTIERDADGRGRGGDRPAELYSVVAVDGDPSRIPDALLMADGRWMRRTDEIVVGKKLSRERGWTPGTRVRLGGREFLVVGVGRVRGVGYTGESFVYMDVRSLRQRTDAGDVVNFIIIDTVEPRIASERIPDMDTLSVYDVADIVRQATEASRSAIVLRWIMVALTLVVAALFVGNMLSGSVAARRLELATLRAIGIASSTILSAVAAEAVMINLLASVVGVLISLAFGLLINGYLAPMYGLESLFVVDRTLFLLALGMAVTMGLVSGLFPARQATRVDPVEVLREA
ncbi:MAG: ABC transporter permease [Chloroflexota bacterium]